MGRFGASLSGVPTRPISPISHKKWWLWQRTDSLRYCRISLGGLPWPYRWNIIASGPCSMKPCSIMDPGIMGEQHTQRRKVEEQLRFALCLLRRNSCWAKYILENNPTYLCEYLLADRDRRANQHLLSIHKLQPIVIDICWGNTIAQILGILFFLSQILGRYLLQILGIYLKSCGWLACCWGPCIQPFNIYLKVFNI